MEEGSWEEVIAEMAVEWVGGVYGSEVCTCRGGKSNKNIRKFHVVKKPVTRIKVNLEK